MVKLKIKVTKKILEKSKDCPREAGFAIRNCAIALAVRDIFPNAEVWHNRILPDKFCPRIKLPKEAIDFIECFDNAELEDRANLPEIEFEIKIPDEVIEKINIDELRPLLENHSTLELIIQ